jgi:hypothetical protein
VLDQRSLQNRRSPETSSRIIPGVKSTNQENQYVAAGADKGKTPDDHKTVSNYFSSDFPILFANILNYVKFSFRKYNGNSQIISTVRKKKKRAKHIFVNPLFKIIKRLKIH